MLIIALCKGANDKFSEKCTNDDFFCMCVSLATYLFAASEFT